MAYLKNWTNNFFQIFFMWTSWVALSIKIKISSREMTSWKNIKILDFNGGTLPSTDMWQGDVFAISDCLVREYMSHVITHLHCYRAYARHNVPVSRHREWSVCERNFNVFTLWNVCNEQFCYAVRSVVSVDACYRYSNRYTSLFC